MERKGVERRGEEWKGWARFHGVGIENEVIQQNEQMCIFLA
jgi:hypothetical protein